jgi:hypothetical protein
LLFHLYVVPESLLGLIVLDAARKIWVCAPCSELLVAYTAVDE